MRNKYHLLLIPILLIISACAKNGGSTSQSISEESIVSSSSNSDNESSPSSSSSSEETSSSSSSSEEKYARNPQNEDKYNNQTYLNQLGNIQSVWDEYRGDNVTIAIIDSGFYIDHTEFKDENGNSKISDKSALITTSSTTTITTGKNNVAITDGNSHGTICATVASGSITGTGTVGVAPNSNLLLIKVDQKPKSIARAFKYAADNGAKVISISLGAYYQEYGGDLIDDGSDLSTVFDESLKYAHDKGVVIVSAAGNGGECSRPTEYTFPGACSYVIGAGGLAYNTRTAIWSGSSYNNEEKDYQFCDVFAPGENLYSGCYWEEGGQQITYSGGFNGTSFASPIIAGAAALYFQKYPTATNIDFERALFNTCDDVISNSNKDGYGAINIERLMEYKYERDKVVKSFYFKDASWWSSDNASVSAYMWNYALTSQNNDFPGALLNNVGNGYWKIDIDTSIYERIIFSRVSSSNQYWGAQTINIDISSFGNNNCYDISNTSASWTSDNNYVIGNFTNK